MNKKYWIENIKLDLIIKFESKNLNCLKDLKIFSFDNANNPQMYWILDLMNSEIIARFNHDDHLFSPPYMTFLELQKAFKRSLREIKNKCRIEIIDINIYNREIKYQERIAKKSQKFRTKSANTHNQIELFVEPLDDITEELVKYRKITDFPDENDLIEYLRKYSGIEANEVRSIIAVNQGNILLNKCSLIEIDEDIKSNLKLIFRNWLDECILARESASGIKVVITDMKIYEDKKHREYGQLAGMMFSAMSLAMLNADPFLVVKIYEVDVIINEDNLSFIKNSLIRMKTIKKENKNLTVEIECTYDMLMTILVLAEQINTCKLKEHKRIPKDIEHEIILKQRKLKGMPEKIPTKDA